MKSQRRSPDEELAFPLLHRKVLEICAAWRRGLILDAAAGYGILSRNLRGMGFRVISTDLEARPNLQPDLQFFRADLNQDLALPGMTVDYVVSLETIEHLENPWHFTRELARILKPGGRLVLSTPNIDYLSCKIFFLREGSFYPFFNQWQYKVIGHITPLSRYYLTRILEKAGFQIEKYSYNRYRIPFFKIPSPLRWPIFGESLIIQAVKK